MRVKFYANQKAQCLENTHYVTQKEFLVLNLNRFTFIRTSEQIGVPLTHQIYTVHRTEQRTTTF